MHVIAQPGLGQLLVYMGSQHGWEEDHLAGAARVKELELELTALKSEVEAGQKTHVHILRHDRTHRMKRTNFGRCKPPARKRILRPAVGSLLGLKCMQTNGKDEAICSAEGNQQPGEGNKE